MIKKKKIIHKSHWSKSCKTLDKIWGKNDNLSLKANHNDRIDINRLNICTLHSLTQ